MAQKKKQALPGGKTVILLTRLAKVLRAMAILCWLAFILLRTGAPYALLYRVGNGGCVVSQRTDWPLGIPEQVAVNDESVFVYFAPCGVVQAYGHDGAYQYAIHLPYQPRGDCRIYAAGTDLCLLSLDTTSYRFQNGKCVQTLEDGKTLMEELGVASLGVRQTACPYGDVSYSLRGMDIYRTGPDGQTEKFINVPEGLRLVDSAFLWVAGIVSIMLMIVAARTGIWLDKRNKRKETLLHEK